MSTKTTLGRDALVEPAGATAAGRKPQAQGPLRARTNKGTEWAVSSGCRAARSLLWSHANFGWLESTSNGAARNTSSPRPCPWSTASALPRGMVDSEHTSQSIHQTSLATYCLANRQSASRPTPEATADCQSATQQTPSMRYHADRRVQRRRVYHTTPTPHHHGEFCQGARKLSDQKRAKGSGWRPILLILIASAVQAVWHVNCP